MADHTKLAQHPESAETNARLLADAAAQLAESAKNLDRASRLLPTDEEFHFYSNFSEFREPVRGLAARVHASLSKFSSPGIAPRAPPFPCDRDDLADCLVSMQDELLEQVDSAFDLFKKERAQQGLCPPENDAFMYQKSRKKRRRDMPIREEISTPSEAEGKPISIHAEKCPVPFHVWSIPRPQDKFDNPVDNSNTPFRHPQTQSNLMRDAEPDFPTHPLWEELQNMSFERSLIGVAELDQPASLEETPCTFVNTRSLLEDAVAKLALETEIAVDLEHHQFRSFQGITCLMQVSTHTEDFIIDTLELRSIIGQCLYDIFASPTIQKVMHGASFDVIWLQRDFGIYICNLFDTGQAARVLELESFGLAHLLTQFCGFTPDKRYQMADWRLRPLPVEMMKYGREDTHYLLYIKDILKQRLLSLQSTNQDPLLEVLRRSRDVCLKLYEKEITTETSYLQVYGLEARKFNSQQLAVLSGLYSWRDQIARAEDESTGYVLPNHLLLKLAEEMPEDVKMLRTLLNGRHTIVARNSATIVNIIKTMKMLPQRPIMECSSNLEVSIEKSPPVFEEIPFLEANAVGAVFQEERNNDFSSAKGSCAITGTSEVQAKAVVNRTTRSLLFGMQKVRDEASDNFETPRNADCTDAFPEGENVHELNSSRNTSALKVVVKRASGSSLFCKTKKLSRVVHDVQDTSRTLENETLTASKTIRQEANKPGREVDDLASMLGYRTSLQSEINCNSRTEDFEQAEAKSRAEVIRASFSLPFYTFDGGDSSVQVHRKGIAEQGFAKDHEAKSGLQDKEPELELPESEDVILLDMDINNDTMEKKAGEASYVVDKGIGITSDGVQHRLWWPDTTESSPEPSLDKMEPEPCDTAKSSIMDMELPIPLSQRFRSQRGSLRKNYSFSELNNSISNDTGQEEPKSFQDTNQMQLKFTPFDYEVAKKNMGLFRVLHGTDGHAERAEFSEYDDGRRENTQVFDPEKNVKEFRPEGITPGKRRQVFPQSGNRMGVFK